MSAICSDDVDYFDEGYAGLAGLWFSNAVASAGNKGRPTGFRSFGRTVP